MSEITQYTVFGERCSGTNYLQFLMHYNFSIPLNMEEFGWKHMFEKFDNDFQSARANQTLFLCIVRNPFDWIESFHRSPHHVPHHLHPLEDFLTKPFETDVGVHLEKGKREAYQDIFDMRYIKSRYLLDIVCRQSKYHMFVRYEDIRDNPIAFLEDVEKRFQLQRKQETFQCISNHTKTGEPFVPRKSSLPALWIEYVTDHLNREQEASMGYHIT